MATQSGFCQAGTLSGDSRVRGKQQPVSPQRTALNNKSARWCRARVPAEGLHGVDGHGATEGKPTVEPAASAASTDRGEPSMEEETTDPEIEALERGLRSWRRNYQGELFLRKLPW